MNSPDYFLLYAHNVPVRGRDGSAIYDLRGGRIIRINNRCFDLLATLKEKPIDDVRDGYSFGDPAALDQCLKTLLDQNLGFITETPQFFPELNLNWVLPNVLHTAIVEHNFDHYDLYRHVLKPLDRLLCRHIEFRIHTETATADDLLKLAHFLSDQTVKSVSYLIQYAPFLTPRFVEDLYEQSPKTDHLIIYSAPHFAEIKPQKVYFVPRSLEKPGSESARYVINTQYFTEALRHNPYYNRKVAVDRYGRIKNCLQLATTYGNVALDSLSDVVQQPDFQELWFSAPDCILEVQDSPLRYGLYLPYALEKTDHPGQYQIARS